MGINIIGGNNEYKYVESEKQAASTIIDDLGIDKSLFEYAKP